MGRVRLREFKQLDQGHADNKYQDIDLKVCSFQAPFTDPLSMVTANATLRRHSTPKGTYEKLPAVTLNYTVHTQPYPFGVIPSA